jgi:hypothetical protein
MMRNSRPLRIALLVVGLCGLSSGCRSSNRWFSMDSNSSVPWFGFDLSLPQRDARRKTLETISDTRSEHPAVQLADRAEEPALPPRNGPLSRLLQSSSEAIPLPPTAATIDDERIVELQGPREEFGPAWRR